MQVGSGTPHPSTDAAAEPLWASPERLPLDRLAANFADIAPPLTPDAAILEANKCLFCHDAPCAHACPTHIDVPSFIRKIATGNLKGAARVILDANPVGHTCARACPVEVLCEGACVLEERDEMPIRIGLLQRHAGDWALEKGVVLFAPGPPTGKRVAVVGAGPAGLSCAQDLRRLGHEVVIFDEREQPGGLDTYAIAEYKMRPETSIAEAAQVLALGVELRRGVRVGADVPFADLERDFDAVFVGVGLGATRRLGIPGEELAGVFEALAFIRHLKTHPYEQTPVGRRVVVLGAGNTAIDAATQAKRLGAERVTILYRRGEAEMPAYAYEYELAKKDGVEFRFYTVPRRIVGDGRVQGIECTRSAPLSGDGAGGRAGRLADLPASEHVIECDMVLEALGQEAREEFARAAGLRLDGTKMSADRPKVFVGGDCASGGGEVVEAAAEGKWAALRIHALLTGVTLDAPLGMARYALDPTALQDPRSVPTS